MSNNSVDWPFPTFGLLLGLAIMPLAFLPGSGEVYAVLGFFVVMSVFVALQAFPGISPVACFFVLPILAAAISIACALSVKTTKARRVVANVGTFVTLALTGGSFAAFRFMTALQS